MEQYPFIRIRDLAVEDRPLEKVRHQGISSLSNTELLAILIGTGTREASAIDLARKLMMQTDNDLHRLGKMTLAELSKIRGVGATKSTRILAAFEISRRKRADQPRQRSSVRCSEDAYQLLEGTLADLVHEEFWILLLNRANQLIEKVRISQGGISGTVTDIRLIMHAAVEKLASGIILAHNHPSGNLKPSDADLKITNKIRDAALLLDISLLDHLIISDQGYLSMADENLMV